MPTQTTGIRELVRKCGRFPVELDAELRPATLTAADVVAVQVRANAGFSSRIPGQVKTAARFTASGGAEVRTVAGTYPHVLEARVLEGDGVAPAEFRHPVYDAGGWAPQMSHPFQGPAVREKRPEAVEIIRAAVHRALT